MVFLIKSPAVIIIKIYIDYIFLFRENYEKRCVLYNGIGIHWRQGNIIEDKLLNC